MNKHTVTSGPTGLGRIRSLLAFRHGNPVARLISALLAIAIAMLLVVGTGPAYADDTDPAPDAATSETTEDPAPAAEEPAQATEEPAPASEEPAPAEKPSPDAEAPEEPEGETATGEAKDESTGTDGDAPSVAKALATIAGGPSINLVGNAACEAGSGTLVGGFEIDGDPCDETGIDFNGGPGDSVDDPFGDADTTSFTGGSSESDDPATWAINGPKPTGKADIGTAWAFSHTDNGTVYAYFGFTNDSTSGGTQDYSLEYNQSDPVNGLPVRTPGDLLFHFFSGGNNVLDYEASYIYRLESDPLWNGGCVEVGTLNAGWCPKALPVGAFVSDASATGEFVEGSIDISAMFGEGNCSGTFGTTFLRSAPGAFWTSQMKDYVAPLSVTTPSTCGQLVINKTDIDTGEPVAGAVFGVTGDPRPGGDPTDTYCVFDGVDADKPAQPAECDIYEADGTADGTVTIDPVEPGTYTVTELVAPPGYLLRPEPDPGNSLEVTVGESETETVTFANQKQWQPLDVSKTADGTFSALYTWNLTKQIAPTADGPWSDHPNVNSPLVKDIEAGGDTNLYYRVVVTEGSKIPSDYVVSGTIHVDNPNDAAVTATIDESLTGCTIEGAADPATVDVPAGGEDYDYTCDLGDGPVDPGTNTATITWDKSDYPQTTADIGADGNFSDSGQDGFTFTETESVDETITVTDDHFTFNPAWMITWGDEVDGTYESGVYSFDTEAAVGTCSLVITNTATITGDDDVLVQTSENGQVCVEADLTIESVSVETLTRTFPWQIVKDADDPEIYVRDGQATADYTATVTALPGVDSAWVMTGTITVENPNDFDSKSVNDIDVAYTGGGDCDVTDTLPQSIPANDSFAFQFSCDFTDQPAYDGTVNVTVYWDDSAESADDSVGVVEADWGKTLVNDEIDVLDDHVFGPDETLDSLTWADVWGAPNHEVTLTYSTTFEGDQLPDLGTCDTLTNTAWIVGDADAVLDSDTAAVEVCNPYTQIQVLKVDEETGEVLAGAEFSLTQDGNEISTVTTGADGTGVFPAQLLPGDYVVTETVAPPGYELPADPSVDVSIGYPDDDPTNFVENGVIPVDVTGTVFEDIPTGSLVFAKAHFERDGVNWVPSDGQVDFGDEIRYVMTVTATGPKIFHDVEVTDYVPGYNPADTVTAPAGTKAELDLDSITCGGDVTCTSSYDAATGLITWELTSTGQAEGDVRGEAVGTVEFVVRMPDIPGTSPIQAPGTVFAGVLWNQAYLAWAGQTPVASNEVTDAATATLPPAVVPPTPPVVSPPVPPALPNTGGPNSWLLLAGLVLVLGGGMLVAGDRRRRHRS